MGEVTESFPEYLDREVDFPDGSRYVLLEPLTSLRECQDGTPAESRILFTCRKVKPESSQGLNEDLVMKIKVQVPRNSFQEPEPGPSTTTCAELKALDSFRLANNTYTPHLVDKKQAIQGANGPLPGGYINFTVMTKMVGQTLFQLQYWTLPTEEREEIVRQFLEALRSIYALGIEPIDRGLRNIIWCRETKTCRVIDFELWNQTDETFSDETKELQRWGLMKRPPPTSWWDEWSFHTR